MEIAHSLGWTKPLIGGTVHATADVNNFNGINFKPYYWEADWWLQGRQWGLENLTRPNVIGLGLSSKGGVSMGSVTGRLETYSINEHTAGVYSTLDISGSPTYKYTASPDDKKGGELNNFDLPSGDLGFYMFFKWGSAPKTKRFDIKSSTDGSLQISYFKFETSVDDSGNTTIRIGITLGIDYTKKGTSNLLDILKKRFETPGKIKPPTDNGKLGKSYKITSTWVSGETQLGN